MTPREVSVSSNVHLLVVNSLVKTILVFDRSESVFDVHAYI